MIMNFNFYSRIQPCPIRTPISFLVHLDKLVIICFDFSFDFISFLATRTTTTTKKKETFDKDEVKKLRINFYNFGIYTNYIQLEKKLKQAMYLWSSVKINTLERLVVSKTFLLSKIYFLAQFVVFS